MSAVSDWDPSHGPTRLSIELARSGFARLRMGAVAREAALTPWTFAAQLFGATPRMVERQPIRAVAGGRSFASTDVYTPFHTDSQLHLGAPPDAQVMVCARAASVGGETLLVDAWALTEHIERDDRALFEALFRVDRHMPFVFGDIYGPTLTLRGGALAFTHPPVIADGDPMAARVTPHLARTPRAELRVEAGEVLVVDNRRMLHGRNAFRDPLRDFVRLLVWLDAPFHQHPRYHELARPIAAATARRLEAETLAVKARFGVAPRPDPDGARRLRIVLEMLRGTPPGALSHREGVPEPELYRWRDAALAAAHDSLSAHDPGAIDRALARVVARGG